MKKLIFFAVAIMVLASGAYSQNVKYEAFKIAELSIASQWEQVKGLIDLMFDGMSQKAKEDKSNERVNLIFVEEFRKGANQENVTKFVAMLLSEQLTEPELKEVLAFYQSPTGKKFLNANFGGNAEKVVGIWLKETCLKVKERTSFFERRGEIMATCNRY